MALSEARKRANAKYNAKAYENIQLRVKTGDKDKIKAHADAWGQSLNSYVVQAIDFRMSADDQGRSWEEQKKRLGTTVFREYSSDGNAAERQSAASGPTGDDEG